jgi:hypothetical protein
VTRSSHEASNMGWGLLFGSSFMNWVVNQRVVSKKFSPELTAA